MLSKKDIHVIYKMLNFITCYQIKENFCTDKKLSGKFYSFVTGENLKPFFTT